MGLCRSWTGGQMRTHSGPVQHPATSSTWWSQPGEWLALPGARWQLCMTRQVAALLNQLICRPAAGVSAALRHQQQQPGSPSHTEPCMPCQASGAHLQQLGGGVLQLGCSHPAGGDGAELSILGTDGQGQLSRERVRHRMEGLHRGQAPVLQVPPDFGLQPAAGLRFHHTFAHSCWPGPLGMRA